MADLYAVDVGGTFTDVVALRDGRLSGLKVPTSPDQANAVVAAATGHPEDRFLHGTTVATNTLLQAKGARVALVTTQGYEDLIEVARQDRPSLYDSSDDRAPTLVAREDRLGAHLGAEELARRIEKSGSEAVAIGLIESHVDDSAEVALADGLQSRVSVPVVVAADVSPEFREYERLATTVLSAYLTPSVSNYLETLDARLPMSARLVMTSAGGLVPFAAASRLAGRLVLSGPAGGVVAAAALARQHGLEHVLSFDMGGTSTDVCRISHGVVSVATEHRVAGRVNRVPSVPVRTIGAGGGSVGWVDPGGALRVGPRSAGAIPGPASYGLGGQEPTVTDANLLAGHIPPSLALGGSLALSVEAAMSAVSSLGGELGLGPAATASGIIEVADSLMIHALRSISVEEGADPRDAVLVAFGGAGGLHATRLARALNMRSVMVPPMSGVFSALGLMMAVPRADSAQTVMLPEDDVRYFESGRDLVDQATTRYRETFGSTPDNVSQSCDVRYQGQSHELAIESSGVWQDLRESFESAHEIRFGFRRAGEPIEIVNIRATATGSAPVGWADLPPVRGDSQPAAADGVWARGSLPAGFTLAGPAVVAEANSATLVAEDEQLSVLEDGTLEITW